MLKKIEALRMQPKHIRNRYAFWIALFVASCIAVVWILSVPVRFSQPEDVTDSDSTQINEFSDTASDILSRFTGAVEAIRSTSEYVKSEQSQETVEATLDLNAMIASSSMQKATTAQNASTTPQVQ